MRVAAVASLMLAAACNTNSSNGSCSADQTAAGWTTLCNPNCQCIYCGLPGEVPTGGSSSGGLLPPDSGTSADGSDDASLEAASDARPDAVSDAPAESATDAGADE